MFTAKDLEVYKDALKEKKNKTTNTGEKPLKTTPSVAKISKLPSKLQNEEPFKERKPLSVVHKASNTIKEPHKPPSPIPGGTSKQTNPGLRIKTKEIASKSPSPGLPTEADTLVKASDIKSELPKSPRDTSLLKSSHVKLEDNKSAGMRKLKEPSTPRTSSNGVSQKTPPLSGVKVAPAANVNTSLCSECTRAASEGAVCFIGNDGRVSACTTRAAVRLCKNLNCAANNPEYVAAMANAPKKYLISKRHSLKAQFGPRSKSGRSKSPNLQQIGAAGFDEWHHSSDTQSPSPGDISRSNGGSADLSSNNFGLECEDGGLRPFTDSSRLLDVDMSFLDGHDTFCDSEIGPTNDVMRGAACVGDDAAAELGIAECGDDINGAEEFSTYEGEANDIESPKLLSLDSSKGHDEALAESDGYTASHPYADGKASEPANSEELEDVDVHVSSNINASETGIATTKDHKDMFQRGGGEQDTNAETGDMDSMVGVSQFEGKNQSGNAMSTTDSSQVLNDVLIGNKPESNQIADSEQIGGETSTVDANQVTDNVIVTGQHIHNDVKHGDLIPTQISQVGDEYGDSTSIIDTHSPHNYSSGGTESSRDDRHSDAKSLLIRHVADNGYGDDVLMLDGGHVGDDVALVNDALSVLVTLSNGKDIADDDQNDVNTLLSDQHGADDDLTSPHGMVVADGNVTTSPLYTQVANQGNDVPSPHGTHVASNEESEETASLDDKQRGEDFLSHGLTPTNDGDDDVESDEDSNEDGETDQIVINMCVADDNSPTIDMQKSLDSPEKSTGSGGTDGPVTSSSMKKGSNKQRRRRVLNAVEELNPEKVILRKQQMLERKQAEEWMANHAIEGAVHKLVPTGEGRVKILVEAFEAIISHTDAEGIDTHNASREKHTIA